MFKLKNEKGKPMFKESRLETIKEATKRYRLIYEQNKICERFANWWYERHLLGYAYFTTLRDIFLEMKSDLIPISEIIECPENRKVAFIGYITENPTRGVSRTAKKSKYVKFMIEDETGSIKVMIFNQSLEECETLNNGIPEKNDIVIVTGVKKGDAIFANTVASQQNKIFTKLTDIKDDKTI
jgi:RPA family protein